MDPSAFGNYYSPLGTSIPSSLRYPYPPTPNSTAPPNAHNTPGGGGGHGGLLFYQPSGGTGQTSLQAEMAHSMGPLDSKASCSSMEDSEQDKRPVDKKLRRQIANSNERRRMQSINSGFHTLRLLMPHLQGEKLSKASVLQHAAEHIFRLNQERERLIQQNSTMRIMLTKYWATNGSDTATKGNNVGGGVGVAPQGKEGGETSHTDGKVSKATSPIMLDDEKAAAKELEQIFSNGHEIEVIKEELQRERALRISAEAKNRVLQDRLGSGEDSEEGSDSECFSSRKRSRTSPEPRNNLDIIVRAIRQIEGDAFSRSATPTCITQERSGGLFVPITTTTDTSRMSPITPVFAS